MYLGTVFDLTPGRFTVGRQEADLLLSGDNQVSRQHAQLVVSPEGIATVTDLGSTNGTLVNNQRVQSLVLGPGDVLQIGTSMFKVEG
jgi:pSer/pThr/pTyr-binding forkhead associated (FHA) protein